MEAANIFLLCCLVMSIEIRVLGQSGNYFEMWPLLFDSTEVKTSFYDRKKSTKTHFSFIFPNSFLANSKEKNSNFTEKRQNNFKRSHKSTNKWRATFVNSEEMKKTDLKLLNHPNSIQSEMLLIIVPKLHHIPLL